MSAQGAGEAADAGNELAAVLAAMQRLMLDPAACALRPSLQVDLRVVQLT